MERKAKRAIGKPKNRFLITRGVVNGILKRESGQLDFRSISKIASIVSTSDGQLTSRYGAKELKSLIAILNIWNQRKISYQPSFYEIYLPAAVAQAFRSSQDLILRDRKN
ncbi:hypothetical protein HPODL_04023 [Ogataea parapolymorpha DL-1]|uniref:Uncharacterized protein n=1 Tax=Ogataea parapolymorpha (strain ATCC 26012 / BCRC 20466 / JCM 22074 / NRRL Y-7560 / DL-1) TaxID=871575 RepID=W1QBH4_OGAPD|nr:hypothetical protein HPODL_04023 [Ogataea parapolymorpha DL-1]ESW98396.1 hypothetical protein HPODL_04023 [Ogataea parapolymorpha DL-1]